MSLIILLVLCLKICIGFSVKDCNTFVTCGACIGHAADNCVWCPAVSNLFTVQTFAVKNVSDHC